MFWGYLSALGAVFICRCWGEDKVPPFLGSPPFSIKHPQDNFSLQNANRHPPKYKLARGDICVFLYKNCRLEVANPFLEGVNWHFGGWQFTCWRLKLSWGCFPEKGWSPKRVVLWLPERCYLQKNPPRTTLSNTQERDLARFLLKSHWPGKALSHKK